MEEESEIRSLSDVQTNNCKQLQSNLNYFNKKNLNNDLFFSRFEMSNQELDDEDDEDIATRNSVQELKWTYKSYSNSSQLRNEILKSEEELKNNLSNDVKKGKMNEKRINNVFNKLHTPNSNFSEFEMSNQELDEEDDEDIAIRNSVQELKGTYKSSSNSSQLQNEILKSVEELKNNLSNDVKKGKMNEERIKNVFNKLNTKITETQEKVLNEMGSLSEEDQEQIATFWEISSEFVTKLLDWFLIKYKKIVKLIKKGASYAIKKIKEIIGSATIWIKDAYNN